MLIMCRTSSLVVLVLVGCSAPQGDSSVRRAGGEPTTTEWTDTAVDTGTYATTTTGTGFDCTAALPQPPFQIDSHPISTEEDFDFATGGYLVYQSGMAVVGTDKAGATTVLSPGAAGDPRGVHGLSDGRIAIMSPWDGSIKIADPATNGLDILAGGLNTPNGVEVDLNDRIYFTSYGEVGWTEPDGSAYQVIHSWAGGIHQVPNGIAMSPDEQHLTVAVPQGANTQIVRIERIGPDEWGNVHVLATLSGYYSTLDTDVCGNIYMVDFYTGDLRRVLTDGTSEYLGTLEANVGIFGFSAMRFGPGHGGWERDRLYVSKRNEAVFEVHIGVPGRPHPTTP